MNSLSQIKTILVIKNRAMGDAIISFSALSYIQSLFAKAKIIYAIPLWIFPLFRDLDLGGIEVHPMDFKGIKDFFKNYKLMRNFDIDLVIELHQRASSARFFRIDSFLFRYKYFYHNHHEQKVGPNGEKFYELKASQRDLDGIWKNLQTNFLEMKDLKRPSWEDYPIQTEFKNSIKEKKKGQSLENGVTIILGVVASRVTKIWPLKYYQELCWDLQKQVNIKKIFIPLSKKGLDLFLFEELKKMPFPKCCEFIREDLSELPQILSMANLYIGNDTGIKHLCAALGIRTLTFFGPEGPDEWHPYSQKVHPYFFLNPLACRTQTSHYCGLDQCHSMACLNIFSPQDVFVIVDKMLKENLILRS